MSRIPEYVATGVLALAAAVIAGAVLHREFTAPRSLDGALTLTRTEEKNWNELTRYGDWIGDSTAKVKIVEFADFECPFCKRFHQRFLEAKQAGGSDVALLFVEYPLPIHKFARPAALAAECARSMGHFEQFHDALFDGQDSLGLRSWAEFARRSGIADTVGFNACVSARTTSARLDGALAMGQKYRVHGTPTVIINGWRTSIPPYDSLTAMVMAEMKKAK